MGFEVKFDQGTSGEQAEIRGVDDIQLATSFIAAVKQCVARKILNITINVTGIEAQFPQIKDSIVKLNQFLVSKGHKLKFIGAAVPEEELSNLQKNGITVLGKGQNAVSVLRAVVKEFEKTGKLPGDAVFLADAETERVAYSELLERNEKLETELKAFRTHRDTMLKSKISPDKAKKELGKLQGNSQKNSKSLEEISKKKGELSKIKQQADDDEKKLIEFIKKAEQDNRKKEEGLKKEIDQEKTRFQKIEQEFTKKSDGRLAEIKKLQAPKSETPPKK